MLLNLFFTHTICDGEWSYTHMQKSAYTLETLFKNVQVMVTRCKTGGVTGYGLILQGIVKRDDTIIPMIISSTCKTQYVWKSI